MSATDDPMRWLRQQSRDPKTPARLPGSLGVLTGQDACALRAIAGCWELYARGDSAGASAALEAIPPLLLAMQPKCRAFARELIPWALDWSDRERLWPLVSEGISVE